MNRTNNFTNSNIRKKALHELAGNRLPRRDLMHRLGLYFELSDRWLGVQVTQMIKDGLIETSGRTSNQSYGLTPLGYGEYIGSVATSVMG